MLEKEFRFYLANKENLVKEFEGRFLVIKDEEVKGAYNSEMEAYSEAVRQFDLGTFLIQLCVKGEDAYTQTFHSRASFA
jgi:hypothetical protein